MFTGIDGYLPSAMAAGIRRFTSAEVADLQAETY
jgi:hypothetical protein